MIDYLYKCYLCLMDRREEKLKISIHAIIARLIILGQDHKKAKIMQNGNFY